MKDAIIYAFAIIGFITTVIILLNAVLRVISIILSEIWKFIKDKYKFCYKVRHAFEQNEEIRAMSKYRCCGKCQRFIYTHGDHWGTCPLEKGSGMHARLTADMAAGILHNVYMRPEYKRPYFYINNVNLPWKYSENVENKIGYGNEEYDGNEKYPTESSTNPIK